MITKSEAVGIAAGWHSVMTWEDPGVTMYALSSTGRIQSPEHRAKLIDYIKTHCIPVVTERVAETKPEDEDVVEQNRVDAEELNDLLEYVETAPLEPA